MPLIVQTLPPDGSIPLEQHQRDAQVFAGSLGVLATEAILHLFKFGTVTSTDVTTAADFFAEEADYTGYAALILVGVTPEPWQDEETTAWKVTIPSQQFNHGAPGIANDIGGWYLTNTGSTQILASANFDEAVPMADATDSIILSITRAFGG